MPYRSSVTDDPLYDVQRQDVFDYEAYPRDSSPLLVWSVDIPERFTWRAAGWIAVVSVTSVLVAFCLHLYRAWPELADFTALAVGCLFSAVLAFVIVQHYLGAMLNDARVIFSPMLVNNLPGMPKVSIDCWTKKERLAVFGAATLAVAALHLTRVFGDQLRVTGNIRWCFLLPVYFIVCFAATHAFYLYHYRRYRYAAICSGVKQLVKAIAFYFEPDFRREIPNAYQSYAGTRPFRVTLFAICVFFLAFGMLRQSYFGAIVPAALTGSHWENLTLAHPYRIASDDPETQELWDSRADQLDELHAGEIDDLFDADDLLAHYKSEGLRYVLKERERENRRSPLGWIQALPGFFRREPLLAVTSVALAPIAIVVCILALLSAILAGYALEVFTRVAPCLNAAVSRVNHTQAVIELLQMSNDTYERESLFLGVINEDTAGQTAQPPAFTPPKPQPPPPQKDTPWARPDRTIAVRNKHQ